MGRLSVAVVAALALLAAGLSGCGERSEPTESAVSPFPVTVRGAGEKPTVSGRPARRIVALSPGAVSILIGLGVADRVVGVPAGAVRGTDASTTVDPAGRLHRGAVRRARPDLIVAPPTYDRDELEELVAEGGAVYLAPEGSIRQVERAIMQLGLLTGAPLVARRLVAGIEAARTRVHDRLAEVRPVSVFVDMGFFTTVSDRSLVGNLIREARGRNVAGPSPEPGSFDLNVLARRNPDYYVTTSDSKTTFRLLRRERKTRRLKAIRQGHFGIVPARVLEPGPQVGRGLLALARLLHPDEFG